MRWPAFVGASHTGASLTADAERTVNLYVERAESKGARNADGILLPTPGFSRWSSSPQLGGRAMAFVDGRLFAVMGQRFEEYSATGTRTEWGTVTADGNQAQLVYNGKVGGQLAINSGGSIYVFTLATNSFTGPHFAGATTTMLAYSDGYGLAFEQTTGKVYLSALNDFATWSAGTFFQRSKFPDPWQTMFVDPNGLIWLIGTDTFEVWYDANPASTQPFSPLSGLFGRYGIAAPWAFSVSGQGMHWLSRSPEGGATVVATRGSVPTPVASAAVDTAIAAYRRSSRITDAEMLTYFDQGHTFVNTTFPSAFGTWSLNAEVKEWSERGVWNSGMNRYDVWAPRVHADAFGKHLVADRTSGTIWEMDTAISTDVNGQGIRRLRRAPALNTEFKRTAIDNVQLIMDVGVGLASGTTSDTDPVAALRLSNDGGRTFGNEHQAAIGRIGEYSRRVEWNRLGTVENGVIEIVWSDPVPCRVVDAYVNAREGRAA